MITTKVIDGGTGVGKYNFVIYTPETGSGPWPVVVQIPGDGEAGNDPNKAYTNGPFAFLKDGTWKPNMVFIFAQTPYHGGTYNNPLSKGFMRSVMQEVVSGKYPIDKTKIYLTGLSYGADHILFYVQKEDDAHFIAPAAIVPMSMSITGSAGNYPNDSIAGNDLRFKKIPIWAFCGTEDSFYAAMKRFATVLAPAAGITAKLTSAPGGHSGWNKWYTPSYKENGMNIEDWMLQYSTVPSSPVVVAPPPVVIPPAPKTIKSVVTTITYNDGTTDQKSW